VSKEKIERSERERRAARAAETEWARKNSPPFGPIDDARRAVLAGGDWFGYTPGELQRERAARGQLRGAQEEAGDEWGAEDVGHQGALGNENIIRAPKGGRPITLAEAQQVALARAARGQLRAAPGPMGLSGSTVGTLATPAEVQRARGAEDNDPGPKKNWRACLKAVLGVGCALLWAWGCAWYWELIRGLG